MGSMQISEYLTPDFTRALSLKCPFHTHQVDSVGDLIAAGFTQEGNSGTSHALVVKMSGVDGSHQWEYTSSEIGAKLLSVTVDGRDNVFVAGIENDGPAVLKINGFTGELMWTYRGVSESRTVFNDITVDQGTDWVVAVGFTEGEVRCSGKVRLFTHACNCCCRCCLCYIS